MCICLDRSDGSPHVYSLRWMLLHWHRPCLVPKVLLISGIEIETEIAACQAHLSHVEISVERIVEFCLIQQESGVEVYTIESRGGASQPGQPEEESWIESENGNEDSAGQEER